MSYAAIVSAITVRPHPNADRLQLGVCHGHQVVVGPETTDGAIGVFFPTDGQLSHEFCVENELYNESALRTLFPESDLTGFQFGFFDLSRRVRAQRFRGERSDGLWLPIQTLAYTGYDVSRLMVGDTLTHLNGREFCRKYHNPATLRAMAARTPTPERAVVFPKHADTEQFRYGLASIPVGATLYLTEKLHGTSHRYGHVLEQWRAPWLLRAADWVLDRLFGANRSYTRWLHLNGSRNVILERSDGEGFYGTNAFRYDHTASLRLHKGEVVYGEIVGWASEGQPIMAPQPTTRLKDPGVQRQYGDVMRYTYGCADGASTFYVYRIAQLNEDGYQVDLSWPQVKQRCKELGLNIVPDLAGPIVYDGDVQALTALVETFVSGASTLDDRHIREGLVLRVESEYGQRYLKSKSFTFGVLEGYLKDNDQVVDTEEAA